MLSIRKNKTNWTANHIGCAAVILALTFPALAAAQDRDHDGEWHHRDHMTRIEPGTVVPVRVNETINVYRQDNRIYTGTVVDDVFGQNGRLAIPRGSQVNLRVRVAPDNDLVLDIDSVDVHGENYSLPANPDRLQSRPNNSVVGNIIGAVTGAEVHGPAVRVHRGTVLDFQINQPLEMRAVHQW